MTKVVWQRVGFNIVLACMIIWTPWWAVCALALGGIVYFDWYIEAALAGFILDALYGGTGLTRIVFSSAFIVVVLVLLYAKQWITITSKF